MYVGARIETSTISGRRSAERERERDWRRSWGRRQRSQCAALLLLLIFIPWKAAPAQEIGPPSSQRSKQAAFTGLLHNRILKLEFSWFLLWEQRNNWKFIFAHSILCLFRMVGGWPRKYYAVHIQCTNNCWKTKCMNTNTNDTGTKTKTNNLWVDWPGKQWCTQCWDASLSTKI